MKKIFFASLIIFLVSACTMPSSDKQVTVMDRYWKLYQAQNYDSLPQFYADKGETFAGEVQKLMEEVKKLDERFGPVKQVQMTGTNAQKDLVKGTTTTLVYKVMYENAVYTHVFIFKDENEQFSKIGEHHLSL